MDGQGGRDLQLQAIWADQQAQEILLRAALLTCAERSDSDRQALFARIEQERKRFALNAPDPSWRQSVTALIESFMDDLRGELDPLAGFEDPVGARKLR